MSAVILAPDYRDNLIIDPDNPIFSTMRKEKLEALRSPKRGCPHVKRIPHPAQTQACYLVSTAVRDCVRDVVSHVMEPGLYHVMTPPQRTMRYYLFSAPSSRVLERSGRCSGR